MKTVTKTIAAYARALVQILPVGVALAGALTLSAGCSKSDGGGAPVVAAVPPGAYGYGTNPYGGGGVLASAVGDYGADPGHPTVEMSLQFYAPGGAQTPVNYSGPVQASGSMYVAVNYSNCGLMAGSYTIQTAQPGQMQGSEIQGLALVASNGQTQIQIAVYAASLSDSTGPSRDINGNQFAYRFIDYGGGIVMTGSQNPYGGQCQMNFY